MQLPVDPYTQYLAANPIISGSGDVYTFTFTASADLPNAQLAFQLGGSDDAVHVLHRRRVATGGGAEPPVYEPDTGPRVRVNQVGYLPEGPEERHAGHRGGRPAARGS